jgi:hypothetical protein
VTYRTPFVPDTDDEIEALAELSRISKRAKLWTIIPLVVVTAATIVVAVWLHVVGELGLFIQADGSYFVSKGSICAVAGLAGLFTFVPGFILASLFQIAALRRWRRGAARRFALDDETLRRLEQMFA